MTTTPVYRVELSHEVTGMSTEPRWFARVYRLSDDAILATKIADTALEATDLAKRYVNALSRVEPPRQAVYLDEHGHVTGAPS